MIIYWENWEGWCQKERKSYILWNYLVVNPPFKLWIFIFLSVLSLTPISYPAIHSKCIFRDMVCRSEVLSHPSPPDLLVPTKSPQYFKTSESDIGGVRMKNQTVKCFSLTKGEAFFFSKPLRLLQQNCSNSSALDQAASCSWSCWEPLCTGEAIH